MFSDRGELTMSFNLLIMINHVIKKLNKVKFIVVNQF